MSGDFTYEFWMYNTALPATEQRIIQQGTNDPTISVNSASGEMSLWIQNSYNLVTSVGEVTTNTWTHWAIVRVGSTITIYKNGTAIKTGTSSLSTGANAAINISTSGWPVMGYLDDLRITKGIARYTNNFTRPTKAFPNRGRTGHATWNPSDKDSSFTLSSGNLVATTNSSGAKMGRATIGKSSGKWYWETTITNGPLLIGFAPAASLTSDYLGATGGNSFGFYATPGTSGYYYYISVGVWSAAAPWNLAVNNGDKVGIALDMDNNNAWVFVNNTLLGKAAAPPIGTVYPAYGQVTDGIGRANTVNFGQNPLAYTPPNGTFWNPKDAGGNCLFSNNNMAVSISSGAGQAVRTNTGKSSGKWYFEIKAPGQANIFGVSTNAASVTNMYYSVNFWGYGGFGEKWSNGSWVAYGSSFTTSDIVGIATDFDVGTLTFYKNGISQGQAFSGLSGTFYPTLTNESSGAMGIATLNTGATPFAYTPPTGYSAWDSTVYNPGVF
jgi:hypothetical protein